MKIHKLTLVSLALCAVIYYCLRWNISKLPEQNIHSGSQETQNAEEQNSKKENTELDVKAVYSAYLKLLQEKQKDIEAYTWQVYEEDQDGMPLSVETKGIALADVYGDSTPELLFIDAEQNDSQGNAIRANLHIYSFQDRKAVEIAKKENLDYQVGGGTLYNIFLTEKDKRLYLEQIEFDAKETEVLYLLPASGIFPLEWDKQASYSYNPEKGIKDDKTSPQRPDEEFILYDKPAEKSKYYALKNKIQENLPKSLICNYSGKQKNETSALSYSEAISFLEKQVK